MQELKQFEIPGRLSFIEGEGGLLKIVIDTASSGAEIYLHGAHITHFQKKGEEPILFMSAASDFALEKPIRGGIPIIFPWFGPRDGLPAHGFARLLVWTLRETTQMPDGSVCLCFCMPTTELYDAEFRVTIGDSLSMELSVRSSHPKQIEFETCFHTYFKVSSIDEISIHGLRNVSYIDKINTKVCVETAPAIEISSEVDRVYFDTPTTVEIEDRGFGRKICIEKSMSNSTVVWNPWIEKSMRMPDFCDDEYQQMVCVESGNVAKNQIVLKPRETAVMKVVVKSEKLPI